MHMYREIFEQPAVLRTCMEKNAAAIGAIAAAGGQIRNIVIAARGSSAFITAETTAMPAIGLFASTSILSAFKPPIATTGIGTARQISFSVETGVSLVVTCVVVG